jgi:hypothetical protein
VDVRFGQPGGNPDAGADQIQHGQQVTPSASACDQPYNGKTRPRAWRVAVVEANRLIVSSDDHLHNTRIDFKTAYPCVKLFVCVALRLFVEFVGPFGLIEAVKELSPEFSMSKSWGKVTARLPDPQTVTQTADRTKKTAIMRATT